MTFVLVAVSFGFMASAQEAESQDSLVRALQEVVITARQPATRLKGSTLVSTIAGSNLEKAGNAVDVLGQLPLVSVADDDVTVSGRGTPAIYIDGRPMRDVSELRSLQSSDIRKVELVMAPGAQYESTTKAVLRITTRRNFSQGLSVSDVVEVRVRRRRSASELLDFSYHSGAWELFGSGSYDHSNSLIKGSTINTLTYDGKPTVVGASMHNVYPANGVFGKFGFNFACDSRSVGAYYRFSYSHRHLVNEGTEWLDMESPLPRTITGISDSRNHLVSVYYDDTFSDTFHLHFDGNFRGSDGDSRSATIYDRSDLADVNSSQRPSSSLWAGKLYLDFPLGGGTFTVGTQDSYTKTRLDYRMLNAEVSEYIPSSLSDIRQTSLAAFASWNRQFGNFSLSAGLRYEYVDYVYRKNEVRDRDECRTDNFLTSDISLGYSFGRTAMVNLSYRTAAVKPPYAQLSSGLTYVGEHQIEGGNPGLRDERRHDVQLFGQWEDFMLQADFVRSLDTYAFVKEVYPAQGLQLLLHPVNVDVSELHVSLMWGHVVRRWKPEITLGFVKPWMKYVGGSYDKPTCSYVFRNTLTLPHGFYFSADMRGQGSGDIHTNRFAASWFVMDVSVRKTFCNNSIAVKLAATDIFNTRNNDWSINTCGVLMQKRQSYDRRGITLSVRYRFWPRKSAYKGRAASEAEINRL